MFPPIILLAAGGLIGYAHERFRRNRLAAQISTELATDVLPADATEPDVEMMASGDLVQIKNAERSARLGLGVAAVGMYYPPLALVSLPIIGYSTYNWLRTRYQFERPKHKSPLSILATLALVSSLATGFWVMAPLVLTVDLASRKWLANWTKGSHWIEDEPVNEIEPVEGDRKWYTVIIPARFIQRLRYLLRVMLKGEPRWEWFPVLLARVSMGLFFAISGWNKLFTVAHWKGLLAGMVATGLPFPKFLSLFLASVEFYGGSLLTIGFMSTFWSIALAFAMIVAIVTVEIPFVIPPGLGPLDWLDWFLYLPQVLYVIIFLWLIIKGPGPYSVDAVIARKLGFDKDSEEESDDETTDKDSELGGTSWTPLQPEPA
jgi:putative oxidoreductase